MAGGLNLGGSAQHNWRVLVVDDEENLNWSLVTSLRKEKYAAVGALTAEDALRRLTEATFDCVISDVKMPGMDGFELVQWLRERQPQTRVMMMTAFGSPTVRQAAMRAGVVAYLEKPFDLQVLKQELRRVLESGPSAQQIAHDLAEVAQVVNLTRRDLLVQAQTGDQQGMLRFAQGELIWAEMGTLTGNEAFLSLCAAHTVRLRTLPWDGRLDRNVNLPLNRLLYLALSQRDPRAASPASSASMQSSHPSQPGMRTTSSQPAAASRPPTLPSLPPLSASHGAPYSSPLAPFTSTGTTRLTAGQVSATQSDLTARMPDGAAAGLAALQEAMAPPLAALAAMFPPSTLLALARVDGALIAQTIGGSKTAFAEPIATAPAGAYGQLAQAAQAMARAMLLANWGAIADVSAVSDERLLIVKRLARSETTGSASMMCYLCVIAPASVNPDSLRMAIGAYEPALLVALQAGMQAAT